MLGDAAVPGVHPVGRLARVEVMPPRPDQQRPLVVFVDLGTMLSFDQLASVLRSRGVEVGTGFEPVYTDLQSVASPLGHSTR